MKNLKRKDLKLGFLFNHSPAIDKDRNTGYFSHSSIKICNTFKNSKTDEILSDFHTRKRHAWWELPVTY